MGANTHIVVQGAITVHGDPVPGRWRVVLLRNDGTKLFDEELTASTERQAIERAQSLLG